MKGNAIFKVIVHPEMEIRSPFTHPYVYLNLYDNNWTPLAFIVWAKNTFFYVPYVIQVWNNMRLIKL